MHRLSRVKKKKFACIYIQYTQVNFTLLLVILSYFFLKIIVNLKYQCNIFLNDQHLLFFPLIYPY